MTTALCTTLSAQTLDATLGLIRTARKAMPDWALFAVGAADAPPPEDVAMLDVSEWSPGGASLTDLLDSSEQTLAALPFAIETLLATHDRVVVALPRLLAMREPVELLSLLDDNDVALAVTAPVKPVHNATPTIGEVVHKTGEVSSLLFGLGAGAGSVVARWQQVVAESFDTVLQASPDALLVPMLRSLIGADGVGIAGSTTLLRHDQVAAINSGRSIGPAPAFVDCTGLWVAAQAEAYPELKPDEPGDDPLDGPDGKWTSDLVDVVRTAVSDVPRVAPRTPRERLVIDARRSADPYGRRWPAGDDAGFRSWLEQRDGNGLSRLQHLMWAADPELRERLPDPLEHGVRAADSEKATGGDAVAPGPLGKARHALEWRWGMLQQLLPDRPARRAKKLESRFSKRTRRSTRPRRPFGGTAHGWTILGPLRSENGLGQAARSTLLALGDADEALSYVDTSDAYSSRNAAPVDLSVAGFGAHGDINILHANPAELLAWRDSVFARRVAGRHNVAMWFWETTRLPADYLPAFGLVDELWAASSYLTEVFAGYEQVPVHHVGLAPELPTAPEIGRAELGLDPDEFVFLFVFDAMSSHGRKNPHYAIRAFTEATGGAEAGTRLVVKGSNLEYYPAMRDEVRRLATATPRVTLVEEHWPRDRLLGLMANADVYVSLHAAEGYGLTILEAMSLGTPAICTAYSGNMDFTDEANSWLVGYDLIETQKQRGPYPAGTVWADPSLEQAAALMRRAIDDPDAVQAKADAARTTARDTADRSAYRTRILQRLDAIG